MSNTTNIECQMPNSNHGFVALVTVLLVGAVGIAVGVSLILLGISFSRTSLALEQSAQAKALANACSEEALQKIRESSSFNGNGNLSLGGGNCSYTVTAGSGQNRTITINGTIGTLVRKTSIIITQITPTISISSWQETP